MFSVLGPVRLHRQGALEAVGQPRQCAVLASLLLRGGKPVSLSRLVDDVWGDEAPPSAEGSVRTYIYRLRQVLGKQSDSSVQSVDGGYLLPFQPEALDLTRFKETTARAREARSAGNLTLAADLLSEALKLWRGEALAGVPGPFASRQRSFLSQLHFACLEEQLSCEVERGRYAEAAAELSALHVEHPLRERVCGLLMTALYGAGRQSEALMAYHTTSHMLRQHLGVNPSPELQQVHERILSGRFRLPRRDTRPTTGQVFTASQPLAQLPAALPRLVGREKEQEQIAQFVTATESSPVGSVCVVNGVAGVGKTAFTTAVAHRLAERFPDGQLFADMHGEGPTGKPRDPAEVLADFLQALGVRSEALPEGTQARGLLFRDLLANRRVLLVLDNAWDTDELQDLLPLTPGSVVLIASRTQLRSLTTSCPTLSLPLLPLSQVNARHFLACRLGAERVAAEPEAIDHIIECAGRLPLALANVVARAAYRPQMPLTRLAAEYTASEHSALDALHSNDDVILNKRASITSPYRRLDPEATFLFRALSAWPGALFAASDVVNKARQSEQQMDQLPSGLTHAHLVSEEVPGRHNWDRLIATLSAEQPSAANAATSSTSLNT
ncbi:BTAD domain-containing putative transcriptional regulator [Streptomyces sp. NPDC096538]|uniref:AfsR/SARP family transcriptional regulator n=1 Tax=Streptomyces sp. NPDC096538 TaxID=3155427 RepID=UPI00331CFF71